MPVCRWRPALPLHASVTTQSPWPEGARCASEIAEQLVDVVLIHRLGRQTGAIQQAVRLVADIQMQDDACALSASQFEHLSLNGLQGLDHFGDALASDVLKAARFVDLRDGVLHGSRVG